MSAAAGSVLAREAEDFLLWLGVERGRSPATLAAYRRDLRQFTDWLADRDVTIADAAESDIIAYLRHRQGHGLAPSTVARSMVSVRSMFRFLGPKKSAPTIPPAMSSSPRSLGGSRRP